MIKKSLASFMAIGLLGPALLATQVIPMNLVDMVGRADRIFLGVCQKVESVRTSNGLTARQYTFQVRRNLKGVENLETVVFRHLSSPAVGGMRIPGIPTYKQGQEILIFLHADSAIGLTSPVGLSQGLFRVERLSSGQVVVTNSLRNTNLNYQLSPAVAGEAGLGKKELALLGGKKLIALDDFARLVAKIERYHVDLEEKVERQ